LAPLSSTFSRGNIMVNINRILHLALDFIGERMDGTLEDHLEDMGSDNINNLPHWLYDSYSKPTAVINGSDVERFIINVDGSNTSFIDIHSYEKRIFYIKTFALFGVHQIFKTKSLEKKILLFAQDNIGSVNDKLTRALQPVVGPESMTIINSEIAAILNHANQLGQKEYQVHFYQIDVFNALFFRK
jgi:hypothetical protein